MTYEDEDIKLLLTGAVPPLPAPPDRLGAVARRVRRRRRRQTGSLLLAVVLTIGLGAGGTALMTGGDRAPARHTVADPTVTELRCPADLSEFPDLQSARYGGSEPLVPEGAVEITACEVPHPAGMGGTPPSAPRVLTTGVGDLVRMLNSLPPQQTRPGGRSPAAGQPDDGEGLRCTMQARYSDIAYVLRYRDRAPVTVYTSNNCQVVVSGAQGRGLDPELFAGFLDRYRAQVLARTAPASIVTPACPSTLPVSRLRLTPNRSGLDDRISVDNPSQRPQLPTRLVAVTACRYEIGQTTARLTRQESDRDGAEAIRPVLNTASAKGKVTNCGSYPGYPPPTAMDSLLVADATGATAEFWLRRAPCTALVRGKSSPVTVTDALLDVVDELLGPT
ncbi:hypothetical protein ABTX15_04150 [Micromonospora sp. NPDC094482]|uniref:hypothetical protein n=1 Tax=unclassified Micromonospora TaxID=2617518 RepID=UPI00332AB495